MSTTPDTVVRYDVVESDVVGPLLVRLDGEGAVFGLTFLEPAGGFRVPVSGLLVAHARRDVGAVAPIAVALAAYLHGESQAVDVPYVLPGVDTFQHVAQSKLGEISYGVTWTYGRLAAAAGNGRAMRAAASACARNPLPLILPCHRVVPASGGIGRYVGGEAVKARLLLLENAAR